MLKIITSVVLSLVTIMAVTLFAVTVPAQSQKIDDNAAAIASNETYIKTVDDALENLQEAFDGLENSKDIYTIVSANYTSGAPTFLTTELHYFIPNRINNEEDIKDFLTYNTVFLSYYITTVNDVKVTNYRESVATGGGTYKIYSLSSDYLYIPLKYLSDGSLQVGSSTKQISDFYGI